jgi:hypothetical protein
VIANTEVQFAAADLEAAENELRAKGKVLNRSIEETYWELAKVLYEVYDGVPGGFRDSAREVKKELFRKWGYQSFEEWCEREVGILSRSARSLRYAYWWFEIELELSEEQKDHIRNIGRSKVYLLSGFVTNETFDSWLKKAKEMTHDELKKSIVAAKAFARGVTPQDKDMFEYAKAAESADPHAPPPPEHTHTVTTSLYDGQFGTWEAALERAKSITGSDKTSHNLEMMCLDFLSTNDFKEPEDDKKRYIAKMEKLTGLKIIAIDPSSGKPVYGADLLWGMVKQRLEFEKEEELNKLAEANNSSTITEHEPTPSF